MPTAPPPPPPQMQKPTRPPPSSTPGSRVFTVSQAVATKAQRIVIYGEGGIGKTSLAAMAPSPVFIDLDRSVGQVAHGRNVVDDIDSWSDIRGALQAQAPWKNAESVVIDSATIAQKMAEAHVISTVPHSKGKPVKSIVDYGWGEGFQYVYDEFLGMLSDLDSHIRQGRHAILVCHSLTDTAPNPDGDDYKRHEPDLQQPAKLGRIRDIVKNWCDHLLFIKQDMIVTEGKARGHGSRTIYCTDMPTYWAKSRKLADPIIYNKGSRDLWDKLLGDTK